MQTLKGRVDPIVWSLWSELVTKLSLFLGKGHHLL